MNIVIKTKDKSLSYNTTSYDIKEIMKLSQNDVNPEDIEQYIISIKYSIYTNNPNSIQKKIDDLSHLFSVNVSLKKIRDYIYEFMCIGNLGDILGLIKIFGLQKNYTTYNTTLRQI